MAMRCASETGSSRTGVTKKRHRARRKALIPNEEIRWFICSAAAAMGESGCYSDGYSSPGEPNPFPFSEHEIGYCFAERVEFDNAGHKFYVHGHGTIERARECGEAWHAIGEEHRRVLAAYYASRQTGCNDPTGVGVVVQAMRLSPAVAKAAHGNFEMAGAMMLMHAEGETALLSKAQEAVRVAHEIWELERSRIERKSEFRWRSRPCEHWGVFARSAHIDAEETLGFDREWGGSCDRSTSDDYMDAGVSGFGMLIIDRD